MDDEIDAVVEYLYSLQPADSGGILVSRKLIHAFAVFVVFCTFILIVAGALVTSTGSGLAVPDWPLSFGKYFPEMTGGVFYEHSHRMIAGTVGALTFLLAVAVWIWEPRRSVHRLAAVAVFAVALQALLGGITVLYGLPTWVSVAHAVLGQTFFCLTVGLALVTSAAWTRPPDAPANMGKVFPAWALVTALTFLQLFFGAGVRHGAGLLYLKLHLINAGALTGAVFAAFYLIWTRYRTVGALTRPAAVCMAALMAQILLGLTVLLPLLGAEVPVLLDRRIPLVTAHVAVGALFLAAAVAGTLWSWRLSRTPQSAPLPAGG